MNLNIIEGYVEIEGRYPILITALHGFGTDLFKELVSVTKKYVPLSKMKELTIYHSAVDMYTWEIAFKTAVAEKTWAILPTISKVDRLENMDLPDYNLNKPYAKSTPLWRRVGELVNRNAVKIIVDFHGMKNIKRWPDVCISTCNFTTVSRSLISAIIAYLRSMGLNVRIDYPFSGGAFIKFFGKPPYIEAFAIELKRNLRYFGSKVPLIARGIIRQVKEYLEYSPTLSQ